LPIDCRTPPVGRSTIIYGYTRENMGDAQPERYMRCLFARFDDIPARRVAWRAIPKDLGIEGMLLSVRAPLYLLAHSVELRRAHRDDPPRAHGSNRPFPG
jgi:hypothetical protein